MKKTLFLVGIMALQLAAAEPVRVLVVDGANNHDWQKTTAYLVGALSETKRFEIGVSTAPVSYGEYVPRPRMRIKNPTAQQKADFDKSHAAWKANEKEFSASQKANWAAWRPQFSKYDVVVMNYNGHHWPDAVKTDFVKFVEDGGGLVLIHAANNAWRDWDTFNDMIGIGWRGAGFGSCVTINDATGHAVSGNCSSGSGHGSKHPFQVTVRAPDHPIMKDVPTKWLHGKDELYHRMRGPGKNLRVLSSAYSDPKQRGTGEHEPITWEVPHGKGRVIVTSMGHVWRGDKSFESLQCAGFQTLFARYAEYAATGSVTIPIPKDFPSADKQSIRQSNDNIALVVAAKKAENPYCMLMPEEEATTFDLAPGYVIECVASEPMVQEPVLTVWGADGSMYVAEMRSYMQDADGTGTKDLKNGRVKRLVDIDGDGIYDKSTVFVDGLNLPRMILPLDDWIAIRETDTTDVLAYRDTDGDGVADEKKVLYAGGPQGRNGPGKSVEHQDSGLMWNIDNQIYVTYNSERYRYTDGEWKVEKQNGHWTQWGLSHDDSGRLFWIHNSGPLYGVQVHPKYWSTVRRLADKVPAGTPATLGDPYDPQFMQVKSLCLLNDRGGSASEIRGFTSACGQTVYRGNGLAPDDYGDYFACDPTIHVVRQANVVRERGKIMLRKTQAADGEFLRSSDVNSRWVNTAAGPDGTLYVTDMYRGIIQDAPWMNPSARAFTKKSGLANNNQRGRIWRIRHKEAKLTKVPNLAEATTADLVQFLGDDNGWIRDNAQRLLILRSDKQTAPALLRNALKTAAPLGKVHALWTLEGFASITADDVAHAQQDADPRVRLAAVKIAEAALKPALQLHLLTTMAGEPDAEVAEQLIWTLGLLEAPERLDLMQQIVRSHIGDRAVMMAATVGFWDMHDLPLTKAVKDGSAFSDLPLDIRGIAAADWLASISNWNRGITYPKDMDKTTQKRIESGETQYYKHCVSCHGADGHGTMVPGTDMMLAPSLKTSPRVLGPIHQFVPILTNGLMGPLDGKTYGGGFMAPAKSLGITRDDRLAELLSFLRFTADKNAELISKDAVTKARHRHADRKTPWTQAELEKLH